MVLASLGTIGAVVSNPQIVQQGSALIGLGNDKIEEKDSNNSEEDILTQFLQNDSAAKPNLFTTSPYSNTSEPPSIATSPFPVFPSTPEMTPPITPTEIPESIPNTNTPELTAIAPVAPTTESPALATNIFPIVNTPTPNPAPATPQQINIPPASVFPLQETPPQQEIAQNNSLPTQESLANLEQWSEPVPFAAIPADAIKPNDSNVLLTSLGNSNPSSNIPPSDVLPETLPENATKNINDFAPIYNGAIFPNTTPPVVEAAESNITPAPVGAATMFPPNEIPAAPAAPLQNASALPITPTVIAEEVPCIGTETVARVGCEVILMCDILPQLRRFGYRILRENINSLPPEQRQSVTDEEKNNMLAKCIEVNYQDFLKMQIEGSLVYNDFLMMMPREQISVYEKRLNEEFDRNEVPAMIKEFGVNSYVELKRFLEDKLGSSIERERMLSTRNKIIQMWIARSVQDSDVESTHDELRDYYKQNLEAFTTKERVRWKEMFVLYSSFKNKQEAFNKANWLLGEVRRGVNFEGLAKLNSDGLTAPKGGIRDWTKRGDMTSKIIENTIFGMPVNQISNIIEGENGFHIVLVTDHEQENVVPFIDAQANIKRKIKMERLQKKQTEFFDSLKQKYRVIVLRKDFNTNMMAKPITSPLN
jgi:parvulin-like peptidyl-prolyl isomerase